MSETNTATKPVAKKAAKKTPAKKKVTAVATEDIATVDHEPANRPSSFEALHKNDLIAAAQFYGTLEDGAEEELRQDLQDSGVTWAIYSRDFGLGEVEEVPDDAFPEPVEEWEEKEAPVSQVITKAPVTELSPQDRYLIKMTRKNPYFEFRRFKFTQEKPYAIMSAEDAQDILQEEGFRQAYPKELEDFYA